MTTFFCFVLFSNEERMGERIQYHYMRVINCPPAKRQSMAIRWRVDDGPTLNAGFAAL